MSKTNNFIHPYIPNSLPSIKNKMLEEIGVKRVEELYEDIPSKLKLKKKMNLPEALISEYELKKHVEKILSKNKSCDEYLSFLGGGCSNHYVPAICDEINSRSEFLTAYAGEPYEDHGRFQVLFEYQSLMAELLDTEIVNVPTFDWAQAASTACRMAQRITNRNNILVSEFVSPNRLEVIKNYCYPVVNIEFVKHDRRTGYLDIKDFKSKINKNIACLYVENPSYLGVVEPHLDEVSSILKENGALMVVGCDPISLGVLETPANYGADITCGDIQSLGMHQNFGGATGGFIATVDDEKFVKEYPSRLFGIAKTKVEGEWGFGDVLYDDRTSFGNREEGKEYVGTAAALWGITAAVYLSLMGPTGIYEVGENIFQKTEYAEKRINKIKNVQTLFLFSGKFKEVVIDFNKTKKKVKSINKLLMKKGIMGGKDLSKEFPQFGETALFCFTEKHSKEEIDKLIYTLTEILN